MTGRSRHSVDIKYGTGMIAIAFLFILARGAEAELAEKTWTSRPFHQRPQDHLQDILQGGPFSTQEEVTSVLKKLISIYRQSVRPLSQAYKYADIDENHLTEGDITALPRVLFLGPWSTGKSSILNYLLGIENSSVALPSGATPTTTDFTVLQYGPESHTTDGTVLALESSYKPLRKFGHSFLQKLHARRMPNQLLRKVTLIDTPGIIENQKQQERGYPFSDVCQWFIQRADMIILVFDPTKLDVGTELEKLFRQLKGFEAKVHILLNKVDTVSMQELLRVYSALFWNLSPLINVTEPPRVYMGSFWSKSLSPENSEYQKLFEQEELALLSKMDQTIQNHLQLRAIALRQHATMVRNHALIVDKFYETLQQRKSIFKDSMEIQDELTMYPDNTKVFQHVLQQNDISRHDILSLQQYRDFFSLLPIDLFQPLSSHCPYFGSCLLDEIQKAIQTELPELIEREEVRGMESAKGHCLKRDGRSQCDEKYQAKSNYSP